MAGRQQHVLATLIVAVVLLGVVALTHVDGGATVVETTAEVTGQVQGELADDMAISVPAPAGDAPATIASTVPGVSTTAAPVLPTTAPAKPRTVSPTPSTAVRSSDPVTPTTLTPTTVAPATVTAAPATVVACRNSTDPSCGAFRFDPQPGADRPMTVQVAAGPASVGAGGEIVFSVTLNDPDGVSYGSTLFGFGDSGSGDAATSPCKKFGAWDPPARDTARATVVVEVRHTYSSPGTYVASFAFDAGPFDCVDSVTGRGDRPYASSATGTVTVVIT